MTIQVEINDEMMEAKPGELLLSVARRNAAHIGFYCDGYGLCTMCECRILSGADQLNPPTEAEHTWLPPERMAEGYRLGCQTSLRGAGPVKVLTRAEELRRQFGAVLRPPAGTTTTDNLGPFAANVAMVNWEHIGTFPFNLFRTLRRIGPVKVLLPVRDLNLFVNDTVRITQRMIEDASKPIPAPAKPTATPELDTQRPLVKQTQSGGTPQV
ncbi:2Fe-2S iron-sulfur cluster-binding protein [Candidatus Chloroploca sp. Khr17]|uniref:2Fe-2S iron-sulfur cluster-binding protein n=1 Tax=Candidatus Chloroploca sp. Khr17 TaxID=2496869 RepID=UPI00101BB8DD|nr:2Fe-2S iron-sulfur cluster-binding protein [Candidatus Chloroploca sp. Khr17]